MDAYPWADFVCLFLFPTTANSPPLTHLLLISLGNTTSQDQPSQTGVSTHSDSPRMSVSSVATRLYPDASQLLGSDTGPPKMAVCGDIVQTLDSASSKSSSIGKMKLPAKRKPACLVHEAPMIPGTSPMLRWQGLSKTSTLGGPVRRETKGRCPRQQCLQHNLILENKAQEQRRNDKHKTIDFVKGKKGRRLYTGT